MKKVPYHDNPGSACALACYTMVAQYLLPDKGITFEQLAKLANWRKGYVIWGFAAWEWLMNQGIKLIDYDLINYETWAKEGAEGLRKSVPAKEFEFYKENTYDLEAESKLINLMYNHPNFRYKRQHVSWDDVVREFNNPGICDVTLNSRHLNHADGLSVHRVVLLDITDQEVVFHDPSKGPERRESLHHFRKSMEALKGPELARYYL